MSFYFTILFVLIINAQTVLAQPGWVNHSITIGYNLIDNCGNTITLNNNKQYAININGKTCSGINFKKDTVKQTLIHSNKFYFTIAINDFIWQKELDWAKPYKLCIIKNKRDTMYISQDAFQNGGTNLPAVKDRPKISFMKGCYYLTQHYFAMQQLEKAYFKNRKTFQNNNLRLFEITPLEFKKIKSFYNYNHDKQTALTEKIVHRLSNYSFKVSATKKPLHIENSLTDYALSHVSWSKDLDSSIVGLFYYTKNWDNIYSSKEIYGRLDKKTNRIKLWRQSDTVQNNYHHLLQEDTANNTLYMFVGTRQVPDNNRFYFGDQVPYTVNLMQTNDNGGNWEKTSWLPYGEKHKELTKLVFMKGRYAVAGYRIKHNNVTDDESLQFYLFDKEKLVDSFMAPRIKIIGDQKYYCRSFYPEVVNDSTIILGSWEHMNWATGTPNNVYHPKYIFNNNTIKLDTANKYVHSIFDKKYKRTDYKNFYTIDKSAIYFKTGDSLLLSTEFKEIVEDGSFVFIAFESYALLSFDAGKTWRYSLSGINYHIPFYGIRSHANGLSYYDLKNLYYFGYHFNEKVN